MNTQQKWGRKNKKSLEKVPLRQDKILKNNSYLFEFLKGHSNIYSDNTSIKRYAKKQRLSCQQAATT
ncbi:MAG: hypothetical protein K2N12_02340 [Helicobacter sp.]|nr:hypothetical protein [Helicobacter sp.]